MSNTTNRTDWTLTRARPKIDVFLDKLRNSGNVRASCKAASIPRSTVYDWRDKWVTFAGEWDDAIDDACDILEGVAWKRAVESSDRLLMFLLKAHRPDKFKERTSTEVTGKDGGAITVGVTHIDDAIEQELARLAEPAKTSDADQTPPDSDGNISG